MSALGADVFFVCYKEPRLTGFPFQRLGVDVQHSNAAVYGRLGDRRLGDKFVFEMTVRATWVGRLGDRRRDV